MNGAKMRRHKQVEMEEALRHSEERFRALVENIQDIVMQLDLEGRLVYVGPAAELITGYTPQEALGRPAFEFVHAEDVPKAKEVFYNLLNRPPDEGRLTTPFEHRIVTKEGEVRRVETLASVLRDATGRAMGVISTTRDITRRKSREEQLEALAAAVAALTSTLELEPLLSNILAAAIQAIPAAEKGSILMLDEASGELSFRALAGYGDQRIRDERFPRESGYSAKAIHERRPLLIADARADPSTIYPGDIEEMREVKSAVVAPLMVKGRPIGVISLDNASREDAFGADDLRTLVPFADQAALAIENARLFAAEQRRADALELLFETAQATAGSPDPEHILQWLADTLGRRFNAPICSISLFDPHAQTFELRAAHILNKDAPALPKGSKLPISRVPALRQLVENRISTFVSDFNGLNLENWQQLTTAGERDMIRQHDIHSILNVPLFHRDELLGTITLKLRESLPWMPLEEQVLVETVAGHAAVAIANARLHQQTQQRNLALQILHQVSLDISARLDAPDLLQTITERAVALLWGEAGGFYLYDSERDELVYSVACGYSTEYIGVRLKPGEGLAGRTFQGRRAMTVENYHTWEGRAKAFDGDERLTSVLAVPLIGRRGVLAVLCIGGSAGQPAFDDQDIWLAELFAAQAAIAIENAHLHQNTVQATQDLRQVHDLGLALSATLDVRQVMRLLARSAREVTGATVSHVYVRDEETDDFLAELDSDDPERWAPPPLIPPRPDGLTAEIMRTGQPINIPETKDDPRVKPRLLEVGLQSTVGVPLVREGKAIGALFVNGERPGQFAARQLELLNVLAAQAAIAVENARLVNKLVKSERLAAIGQIGVTVRHEINNPLTAVLGNAEFLLRREADRLSADGQEALSDVAEGARRIREIVKKLRSPEDRVTTYIDGTEMIDLK
jgi:PAS domain S-box-containing protein